MVNATSIGTGASDASAVVGKGSGLITNLVSKITSFITSMGKAEVFILVVVVGGGFIVWYLKKKYDLEFRFSPKKPKKTFN